MRQLLFILYFLSVIYPIYGQKILSLEEAIEIATDQNPTIKSAAYNEQVAILNYKAIKGLRLPQINIVGNYSYLSKDITINANNLKQNINTITNDIITSATQLGIITNNVSAALSSLLGQVSNLDWSYTLQNRSLGFIGAEVDIPIFLGGKINAATHIADIEKSIAEEQSTQAKNSLISELIEQYYALTLATHVVELRKQVADGIRRHLSDAIELEQQGLIARSEKLYIEYKMAEAERELHDAELDLKTIGEALCTTLHSAQNYTTITPMFILNYIEDVDYYKHLAINNNPLLSQVILKEKISEQNIRIQRSEFYPQVVAMGVANIYNYQVTNLLPRWAIGIGVSFKLFNGLQREYKYMAAKELAKEVGQIAVQAHDEVELLIEKLHNQLLASQNRIYSIDSSIRFAEEYYQVKQDAFAEGLIPATELIDAELNLAKAKTERLEAAYKYDITLAKLLEAAGVSTEFINYTHRDNVKIIE